MSKTNRYAAIALAVFVILYAINKFGTNPHSPEGIKERCRVEHPSNVNRSYDRCVLAGLYVEALDRQKQAEAN